MLIIDQMRRDDARLRVVAGVVLVGMALLAGGLWRLQILASQRYSRSEEAQSVRLVRVPAVRGKILDREGIPLAENRPSYDVNLYLEELRPSFLHEYTNTFLPAYRAAHGGSRPRGEASRHLQQAARLSAYTNIVRAVGDAIRADLPASAETFLRHYRQDLALPLPLAANLRPEQVARFFERSIGLPGVDLEVQAVRTYPLGSVAAHVLGHLRRADEADSDPDLLMFRYRLPDYRGVAGMEYRLDEALGGRAGVKALRVNSQGYRHEETVLQPTEPGRNIRLALDVPVQMAAERALSQVAGPATRGAAVVLDVRGGEVLALASAPAFNPNDFLEGISVEQLAWLNDERLRPQMNRAVSGGYPPGSIFKIIVGLAALDAGVLNPSLKHTYLGYWPMPGRSINDEAPPGDYDFNRAFKKSSNSYFIDHGLKAGRARIVEMATRFGLGQPTGILLGPEARTVLPDEAYVSQRRGRRDPWTEGDTANLSIGQGALTVSPVQMAMMTAAIANGGLVLEPRLVLQVESPEGDVVRVVPASVRAELGVSPRHLALLRDAMLADVEESDGTGVAARIPGFRVCGKTGTAEVKRGRILVDKITWFVAFAPYEAPRYAVAVVVESGGSGGRTAAPVAREIFLELRRREASGLRTPAPGVAAVRNLAARGAEGPWFGEEAHP